MDAERWQRVAEVFQQAVALPPDERAAYLGQACGDDIQLRVEVQKLLANDATKTDHFLHAAAIDGRNVQTEQPASRIIAPEIEGYEIVRELHRGGQGIVYQAVQEVTRRKVAIKVLLEGPYASDKARRRFEREIELVASLKHPNIISIFHSGQTSAGHQFCAMDYVRGVPLNQYVRDQKLSLEDALRLFAKVCDAVNYAHQKGVIHRDLKPSNILVDSHGEPRVLDFGLAKMVGGPELTLVSMTGQVVGTLPYMSPEQTRANPDEIDTRTDVYALGVILYEMLTGHYPYPVAGQMADVLMHIARTPPTPPSRQWTPGSGVTQCSTRRMRSGQCPINDELETIVIRSLAKERDRRYQSAGALGDDVQHYLAGEPIEARKDSRLYVLKVAIRRNRAAFGIAAVMLATLTGGVVGTTTFALRETVQRRAAEVAEQQAEARAIEAEAARDAAEYQAFLANITAAGQALERGETGNMRRRLDAIPARLRNWEWSYLNAQTDTSLAVLRGHADLVLSAAFNPDGTRVVTRSRDKTARLWDASTGAELAVLRGHGDIVQSATFSSDGTRVVTGSYDKTARLWDASTGAELAILRGHADGVLSAAFSPDGTRVVTASRDNTARLWDAGTGAELAVLRRHEGEVWSATFSPDGTHVVTASSDRTARLWDAVTGAELAVLRGHEDAVLSATFSPDGTRVVTASWDGTARLWDASTGANLAVLRGHVEIVSSAAFSPDGTRVVTASWDGTARLWDASTGAELAVLRGHEDVVLSAAFSPDGTGVVTASWDRTSRSWDADTGTDLAVLRGHAETVFSASFSPDGTRVVTASYDKSARLWDSATGAELAVLHGHEHYVRSAAFSPDGTRVVTGSYDKTARLWDAATGAELAILRGHEMEIYSASFSPDGMRVVTASGDCTARLWDAVTGAELAVLRGHSSYVRSASFSPDGMRVVTAAYVDTAHLWDAAKGTELAVLRGHADGVLSAAFSPDGTRVVTGSYDKTARLWDASTGAELAILRGHADGVLSAAFSPDGTRVVTASRDNTARLWDAGTGAELAVLRRHEEGVWSATFSPDGTRVVTASLDGTARVWDSVRYAERYRQRNALIACRAEAERIAGELYSQLNDWRAVADRLRQDSSMTKVLRQACLNEVLRRAASEREGDSDDTVSAGVE